MRHEPLRVVCYAVNGTGVGHLTRLLSIARWLRRYALSLGRKIEIWFLTSSEADALVFSEGFAAFKIPSKTIVAEAGIDRRAYLALAKQWIWHTLGLLRPDLFIVDTFPRGSFGELTSALDLCRHAAFVYRPVRAEVAARPDFQAMLGLYDLLVVPETDAPVLVPESARDRLVHVGPVLSRERWELLPRAVARERLGVREDQRCVFVSAGGGGDREAEVHIASTIEALAGDPSLSIVIGTGPLYRGRPFPNLTSLPGRAAEYALAFDAAVCAAGYNTFGEMMFAGVPTAFLPQEKLADDQRARAELAAQRGAGVLLERDSDVRSVVCELVERTGAREAARRLVPENGARLAAAELLRLVLPAASVDRAEAALDDETLGGLGARESEVLTLASHLCRGLEGELSMAIARTAKLLRSNDARELRGLFDAVARGVTSSVRERADVCDAVGALAPGDGAAARAAVAEGRWTDGKGVTLAAAIQDSSSLRSSK
jgi:predicted glycosyltransferase